MGISRYTLYKYVKVDGTWRYCKAAYHDNGKIKPDIVFVNVRDGLLEKHSEGRYYLSHNSEWIDAGTDALEAQRKRKQRLALDEYKRLSTKGCAQSAVVLPDSPLAGSRWQPPLKKYRQLRRLWSGPLEHPQVSGCG